MPSFYIRTLGCKVNQVESERFYRGLLDAGCVPVEEDAADLIIINTCTVTGEAESKVRKAIRHALKVAPSAIVLATGCAVTMNAKELSALDSERVVLELDKNKILSCAYQILGVNEDVEVQHTQRVGAGFHTRGVVKIQDGCDNFCTYCIVAHARGPLMSEPVNEIVDEVEELALAGTKEVVLTGINLARYSDLDDNDSVVDLPELIKRISETPITRIRLSSIEPPDVSEDLLGSLASNKGSLHLHIPLQSGCDQMLNAMQRRYTTNDYAAWTTRAKNTINGLTITTDVIVGFPGETNEQFEETYSFCERMEFSKIHVFKYSQRNGTPAADMANQIDPAIKNERAKRLRELSDTMRADFIQNHSRPMEVLVEKIETQDGKRVASGVSSEYIRASFYCDDSCAIGSLVNVEQPIHKA